MSVQEIAYVLEIPAGSVKAYLSRAREELKKYLKEDYMYAEICLKRSKFRQTELENIVNEKLDMIRKDSRKRNARKFCAASLRRQPAWPV